MNILCPYPNNLYSSSLHLYRTLNSTLGEKERVELSRRTIALLLYLLRSPFYDRYTKERLQKFLMFLSQKVPLAGVVCRPLSQYIPEWQSMYFYMWSTWSSLVNYCEVRSHWDFMLFVFSVNYGEWTKVRCDKCDWKTARKTFQLC